MKKFNSFLWGLLLVVVGVIWSLNALEITNISIFFDGWWTLFLIVPSVMDILNKGFKFSNVLFLIIGIGLLLVCQDIITYSIFRRLLVPGIFVLVGLSIMMKSIFSYNVKNEIQRVERSNKEHFTAFSSQEFSYSGEEFMGGNVDTVFGNAIINLSDAKIVGDVVLNVSSIFGKTLIRVPSNVNVKIEKFSLFGGVEDRRTVKAKDGKYTLYIDVVNLFGGLDINE